MPIGREYYLNRVRFCGDIWQDMDQATALYLGHDQVIGQGGNPDAAHHRMLSHICIVLR